MAAARALREICYAVVTVWECEMRNEAHAERTLRRPAAQAQRCLIACLRARDVVGSEAYARSRLPHAVICSRVAELRALLRHGRGARVRAPSRRRCLNVGTSVMAT